jgi:hypothetical protein
VSEQTMTYQEAIRESKRVGVVDQTDEVLMAGLCEGTMQILCGAVAPQLVWEGAQKQGLDSRTLMQMANTDPNAVHELMWV